MRMFGTNIHQLTESPTGRENEALNQRNVGLFPPKFKVPNPHLHTLPLGLCIRVGTNHITQLNMEHSD